MALIEEGRFLGKITSFKAGHRLDVECVRALYRENLLEEVSFGEPVENQPVDLKA